MSYRNKNMMSDMTLMEENLREEYIKDIENDIYLTDLIDVAILQKMQDAFAKMARMAALTSDENGAAVTEPSNFSELCMEYCRKSPIGKARCEQCDKRGAVSALENHKPVSYKCHANLVDFAAPIMLGDRMIGSFIGGQVLPEAPEESAMRKVAKEIGVDEDKFVEAANKTQIVPQAAIDRSTDFIYEFAKIISDMAYSSYVSKQLSKEAMQAAVQKQDFLANMSHEIRTPMNAVLGMAEMALREEMSNEAREYVMQIQVAGKRLLVIINDILDFSKIDSGKMTIVEAIYETEALIADVASVVNSRIGSKDIEFIIDAPFDMPIELYGDYIRIQQILINLLNNAVKFTSNGYIRLKMSFDPIDEENIMFKASVIDTGNGIKAEDIDKLFKSFQQVDSKRNRNVEGTGLGLAICKQLVELMHGSISVESEYGRGSTFSVEFPQKVKLKGEKLREPDKPLILYLYVKNNYIKEQVQRDLCGVNVTIIDLDENNVEVFEPGSFLFMERENDISLITDMAAKLPDVTFIVIEPFNTPNDLKAPNIRVIKKPGYSKAILAALGLAKSFSREQMSDEEIFSFIAPEAKVLVVDDNEINLSVAKGLMEPLEMQVDTAASAMECINLIQAKKYDLIFMDHMMPEVDGIETTHIIRRMYTDYAKTPIIALTANAVAGAKEMFISEGMNDFVAKPIETKKIVAKVWQWLPSFKIIPVDNAGSRQADEKVEASKIVTPDIPGLNVEKALSLLGNEKLYLQFLKEYYLSIDQKTDKILKAYSEGNIKAYTIEVHSLKSSSKQIGAEGLAKKAELLEKAGNAEDLQTIEEETNKLIQDYRSLKERLSVFFDDGSDGEKNNCSLDSDTVLSIIEEITNALDEFDILTVDEALSKLSNYEITNSDEIALIDKIKSGAENFDTEECLELMEEWKNMY